MQGIEFVSDRSTREPAGDLAQRLEQMAFARGLLVLAAGKNALRLAPPLIVDQEDVEIALAILGKCLDELD
jgi:4-aminobutyrate aminotransferase